MNIPTKFPFNVFLSDFVSPSFKTREYDIISLGKKFHPNKNPAELWTAVFDLRNLSLGLTHQSTDQFHQCVLGYENPETNGNFG